MTKQIVPIHLAYVHTSPLGGVDVIAANEERGQIVAWTPVDQTKAAARTLRAAKAPSLTQDFQPFMVTVNRVS